MTENNQDRYRQIYQEVLKVYPQDKKSTVQRKACDFWIIVKEKEKQDESSTIFKDTPANLRKEGSQQTFVGIEDVLKIFWRETKYFLKILIWG